MCKVPTSKISTRRFPHGHAPFKISRLPFELVEKIVEQVDLETRRSLAMTCRAFDEMCQHYFAYPFPMVIVHEPSEPNPDAGQLPVPLQSADHTIAGFDIYAQQLARAASSGREINSHSYHYVLANSNIPQITDDWIASFMTTFRVLDAAGRKFTLALRQCACTHAFRTSTDGHHCLADIAECHGGPWLKVSREAITWKSAIEFDESATGMHEDNAENCGQCKQPVRYAEVISVTWSQPFPEGYRYSDLYVLMISKAWRGEGPWSERGENHMFVNRLELEKLARSRGL